MGLEPILEEVLDALGFDKAPHPSIRFAFSFGLSFLLSLGIACAKYSKLKYKASKSEYGAIRALAKSADFVLSPMEALLFQCGVYYSLEQLGLRIGVPDNVFFWNGVFPVASGMTLGALTGFQFHYRYYKKREDETAYLHQCALIAQKQIEEKYGPGYRLIGGRLVKIN